MATRLFSTRLLAIAAVWTGVVSGQAARTIPVRALAPVHAVSRDTFGIVLQVRSLPGGRTLINDAKKHRLVLLDSTMKTVRVVLDSVSGIDNSYGQRPAPIIPYLGDSTIFVDLASQSFVAITPDGAIGRVMSAPNDRGMWNIIMSAAGVDARGRVVFRGLELQRGVDRGSPLNVRMPGFGLAPISSADSMPIIRGDLESRRVDTIAGLKNLTASRLKITNESNGSMTFTTFTNPLTAGDEWTLMADGTIAIVRGHDYHVDWINAEGAVTSTVKLPFDWKQLSDADKTRARDSAVVAAQRSDSLDEARMRAVMGNSSSSAAAASVSRTRVGGDPTVPPPPQQVNRRVTTVVPITEMGDYVPAVRPGAARGDADGNLWILPTTSAQSLKGELVYDVVNRAGELFQRVRVPLGRLIVGFGKGGVVYLASGDLEHGFIVERARLANGG